MARARWLASIVVLLASANAAAQTGSDVATAQALFDEGKRLMQDGKYEEGCPKLLESQRLDPGGGTLLAIALCHEAQGRTATAWGDFLIALAEARKDHRSDRERACEEHIRALEPKLSRIRLVVDAKADGLEVLRDGVRVGDAQLGTAVPVDPGEHAFAARAPGRNAWTANVTVKADGQTTDVHVPALDTAAVAVSPPLVAPSPPAPAPPPARSLSKDRVVWSVVAGSLGVASVATGTIFGLSAHSKWQTAQTACPRNLCTSPGDVQLGTDAGHSADLSTVFFVVGGAAFTAAALLLLLPPGSESTDAGKPSVAIAPDIDAFGPVKSAGITIRGRL